MKILPCTNDACRADGGARLPRGQGGPYYAVTYPGRPGHQLVYRCGCGTTNVIWPAQFNSLPDLTPADLERHGLLDRFAKSLTFGGAVTIEQARDLVSHGLLSVEDLDPR